MEGGGTDKWLHFGAYAGLGFLLSAVMFARRARSGDELGGRRVFFRIATVVAIGLLYGAADEWLQGFVGRDPDLWDWYAECCGNHLWGNPLCVGRVAMAPRLPRRGSSMTSNDHGG